MKYSNKILYIGTGLHIEPVKHFIDTKVFVFIDTQPRSQFDNYHPKFNKYFYGRNFYSKLIETFWKKGFILENTNEFDNNYYKKIMSLKKRIKYFLKGIPPFLNPTLLVFSNHRTNQQIHYYISTNINFNMTPILQSDIQSCDGIIVSGYNPDIKLLQYIKKPINFFGYTKTSYVIDKTDYDANKQSIIYFLQTSPSNIKHYFKEFFVVVKETGVIYKCADFDDCKLISKHHDIIY